MIIYIIIHDSWSTVESVWDSYDLAREALLKHAALSGNSERYYSIFERKLNQLNEPINDAIRRVLGKNER